MSRVFKFRMPAGIVGSVSRIQDATIVPGIVDSAVPPTGFGEPVKVVGDKIQGMAVADVAADIYGFLVRPYPTQNNGTGVPGTQAPFSIGVADVLRRGWIVVKLNGATAATKRGKVYVRIDGATAEKPIGGIEAVADAANTLEIAGAEFNGPAAAGGEVEIAYNI